MKNKVFKPVLALGATLAICAIAAACNDPTTPPGPGPGPDPDQTTYTVTYNINGATGTTPTEAAKAEGAKFNLAASTGFTKDGFTFDAWSYDGHPYDAGAEFTMPAANVIFTAEWTEDDDPQPGETIIAYDKTFTATLSLNVDDDNGTLYIYNEDTETDTPVSLTYTLSGGTLSVVIGGSTFTGTYNSADGITITISYDGHQYIFEPDPIEEPVFIVDANGGRGTAPTVTLGNYNENLGYAYTLPQNTFEAPSGKEFKTWRVGDNENNTYAPGSKTYAKAGETVHIYAIWQDIETPIQGETIDFVGNCTVPAQLLDPATTYVKFTVDFDNLQITAETDTGATKTVDITANHNSSHKPSDYGSDAYYFTDARLGGITTYSFLISADKTKLWIVNTNDELIANGEFTVAGSVTEPDPTPAPTEHSVEFWVEETVNTVTVQAGGKVARPADPTSSQGKTFRYWADDETGEEYDFDSAVTADISLSAVFAWKVTFSAGEGTGTVDPLWIKTWSPASIRSLPAGTGLSCDGKVFAGWNDGTDTYQAGDAYYKSGLGNVTFTAVWESAQSPDPDPDPDDPPATITGDKLYEFGNEGSANAVVYGYSSKDDAIADGKELEVKNANDVSVTFYWAKVYYNSPTAEYNAGKFFINIYYSASANVANTATGNEVITDVNTANKEIEIVTTATYNENFHVSFAVNSDGLRTITVTYGDSSVTWVEIAA